MGVNFTVVYVPEAEQNLAAAWLTAPDRDALVRAADSIDRRLGRDPVNTGESREDPRRVVIEPPLTAYFEVDEPVKVVRVVQVVLFRTGPRS